MSTANPDPDRESTRQAAVRNYEIFCLAALLVLGLALVQRYGGWCLLPLLVGIQAIYLRMRSGPLLVLLALQLQIPYDHLTYGGTDDRSFDLLHVLQCAAVLGFVAGHYRLQGLTQSLLPADPRSKAPEPSRRPVGPREFAVLIVILLGWAVLAQLAWAALPDRGGELRLPAALWRFIVLVWVGGLGLVLAGGLFGYLRREFLTRQEAALFLQDIMWTEYRGEQRRPSRWLAWARLRYARRAARTTDRAKELP
jgi:hypothetical protein